jgi:hypothetical protein
MALSAAFFISPPPSGRHVVGDHGLTAGSNVNMLDDLLATATMLSEAF